MTPGATSAIRVAVVDDQPLLVSAFSALVGAQPACWGPSVGARPSTASSVSSLGPLTLTAGPTW